MTRQRMIDSALGYLQLDMAEDAFEELQDLPEELRSDPDVLALRIEIFHRLEKWKDARFLSESLAEKFPENPDWWISYAYAVRREKSIVDARGILWKAVQMHPSVGLIHYNLACYACVLGELEDALDLLKRAFALDQNLTGLAANDTDLQPLWNDLEALS